MNFSIICTILIFFSSVNGQTVQYACRFRNGSLESETDAGYTVSFDIYHEKYQDKISTAVNITKDIHMKNIEVVLNRCSFEKHDCEYFQRWKFTRNLKSIAFMKNQMWSPAVEHIAPRPDVPHLKKNFYYSNDVSCDAKKVVGFYPEVLNYFWRGETILNDHNDEKALVLKYEIAIISFVKRDNARDRGKKRPTKPKPE